MNAMDCFARSEPINVDIEGIPRKKVNNCTTSAERAMPLSKRSLKVFEAVVNELAKHVDTVKGLKIEDLLPQPPV